MIKLALLGAWHVHTWMYLPVLLEKYGDEVSFAVVWDHDAERGRTAAKRLGVPFEPDLARALYGYGSQAVIVQCRTTLHKEVVCAAARAGQHIFCEKVLAPTVGECLEIQKEVEAAGVKFMISLDALPYGIYTLAKKLIADGALGEMGTAYVRRVHGMAFGEEGGLPDYWYDNAQTAGGVTMDLATHGISLLLFLFGLPRYVTAVTTQRLGNGQDDISSLVGEFEGGVQGVALTSFMAAHLENHIELIGNKGSLVMTGFMGVNEDRLRVYLQSDVLPGFEQARPLPPEMIPPTGPLTVNAFIELLKSGARTAPGYGLKEAVHLTKVIEAAYRSAGEHRRVAL